MSNTIFVIMGRPGSGKSIQAELLSQKTGCTRFSPGEKYREIAVEDSVLGRKVKAVIDTGLLGPHWLSIYLFQKAILHLDETECMVFEGIGRKKEEAEVFHETMQWLGREYQVFNVEVSEEEIMKRLNLRRNTESRTDDDAEDIPVRIAEYDTYTAPAIAFFESVGKVIPINGNQSREAVHAEIVTKAGLV